MCAENHAELLLEHMKLILGNQDVSYWIVWNEVEYSIDADLNES